MNFSSKTHSMKKAGLFAALFLILTGGWWIGFSQLEIKPILSVRSDLSRFSPLDQNPQYRELLELQSAFIQNAKSIRPAVVSINELKRVRTKGTPKHFFHQKFSILEFKRWLKNALEQRYTMKTLGSGLIYEAPNESVENRIRGKPILRFSLVRQIWGCYPTFSQLVELVHVSYNI